MRKHARATRVEVVLARGPDYAITVRDNGCGFDAAAPATMRPITSA